MPFTWLAFYRPWFTQGCLSLFLWLYSFKAGIALSPNSCYYQNMDTIIEFNDAAFSHEVSKDDIRKAFEPQPSP